MSKKSVVSIVLKAVDNVTGPVRKINDSLKRFTAPIQELNNKFRMLSKTTGLTAVANRARAVGSSIGNVGREARASALRFAAFGAIVIGSMYKIVRGASRAGDALAKFSNRINFDIEALQEWGFVAERSGVSGEELNKAVEKFTKNAGEAKAKTGSLYTILSKVSPSFLKQLNAVKDNSAAFELMIGAIRKLKDPQKQAALANAAFGRSGLKMVNVAKLSSSELAKLRVKARELGLITKEQGKEAENFEDSWTNITYALKKVRDIIGFSLMPKIRELIDKLTEFIVKNRPKIEVFAKTISDKIPSALKAVKVELIRLMQFMKPLISILSYVSNRFGLLRTIAVLVSFIFAGKLILSVLGLTKALFLLGTSGIKPLFFLISLLSKAAIPLLSIGFNALIAIIGFITTTIIPTFIVAFQSLWAVFLTNPIGWIIAGVVALGVSAYLVIKHWTKVKEFFINLFSEIKNIFNSIISFIGKKINSLLGMLPDFLKKKIGMDINLIGKPAIKNIIPQGKAINLSDQSGIKNFTPHGKAIGSEQTIKKIQETRESIQRQQASLRVRFDNVPKGVTITEEKKSRGFMPLDMDMGLQI